MTLEKFENIPANNLGYEGLPQGAKKFDNQHTMKLLRAMWDEKFNFYKETQIPLSAGLDGDGESVSWLGDLEVEVSGANSQIFNGQLHPKAEGYEWFRGIAVKVDKENTSNQVIIFLGWMQSAEDLNRPPVIFSVGEASDEIIRNVIYRYIESERSYISTLREVIVKGKNQ